MGEKFSQSGIRLCDQDGCQNTATHWLVWTNPQVYCNSHVERVLGIARFMGHPTPASTLRAITPDELLSAEMKALANSGEAPPTILLLMGNHGLEQFEVPPPVKDEADVEDYWGE